jgi:hypothetical protein
MSPPFRLTVMRLRGLYQGGLHEEKSIQTYIYGVVDVLKFFSNEARAPHPHPGANPDEVPMPKPWSPVKIVGGFERVRLGTTDSWIEAPHIHP